MAFTPLLAMVRKDLQLFFSDRRSVIVSFVVPIAIASFFGSIFSGPSNSSEPAKISIAVVDHDGSAISKAILSGAQGDRNLKVATPAEDEARSLVKNGKTSVAVVIPKGFGEAAGSAFFGDGEKPALGFLYDPSRNVELAMVRGVLTQHVMEAVSREMFGGEQGRTMVQRTLPQIEASTSMPANDKRLLIEMLGSVQKFYNRTEGTTAASQPRGITMPYTVKEEAMTAGANVAYNGYAHSFAGMAIQFLLFAMANIGVEMLLERQRGLWSRLRSAPISKTTLLLGKAVSGALISLMILLVSFGFAMIVFKVRIHGSVLGFLGISLACAVMASTFGLLVAALGNSPATARGVTTLAVLMMVMLGGAWVPTFIFPAWLQQFTLIVPVRWAVDGLDAMTWRGIGVTGALMPVAVLAAFAVAFWTVAATRFRWTEG
ncbi:MAG TPA: ABC transporter permease [Vicinamibacterales bacterium]|jgi:ABC-2 type transport system permease protein|nr:ABC transporter permease [Vicinamibacterales bacterium]